MLENVNKTSFVEDEVIRPVNLPILFATQGWQFSNIPKNDPKFVEPHQDSDTACTRLSDVDKSIVWSTDGGSYAKNPRIYFIKDILEKDRAYLCGCFLSAVDSFIFSNFGVDVDMSCYGGKYCSESTKCTIYKENENYVLSHYVSLVPYENNTAPDTIVFTYRLNDGYNVINVTVSGDFDVDSVLSLSGELSSVLQKYLRLIVMLWEVYCSKLGVSPQYLEIVRTATEFTMGDAAVRQVGIPYMDTPECCKSYVAVSTMCKETGFNIDTGCVEGSTAICFTV